MYQFLLRELEEEIASCNKEGNLHFQLICNEPKAFDGFMAHYGKFSGVTNYIALIGKKDGLDEKCGYYGERLVLIAQQLGLNTCWVAMSYSKILNGFPKEIKAVAIKVTAFSLLYVMTFKKIIQKMKLILFHGYIEV